LKRTATVTVSRLALDALARVEELGSADTSAKLDSAVKAYLKDRDLGRAGWSYPAFMREAEPGKGVVIELSVDDDLWRSFEAEAARQEVSVDRLAEQAVYYLAAEVEAGRIVLRMADQGVSADGEDQGR